MPPARPLTPPPPAPAACTAFALKHGYLRVVQLSLLGSIVSNLLLVMGSAFIAGGIYNSQQKFSQAGINVNSGLLLLAVVAIVLPSLLSETHTEVKGNKSELALSRFESVLLLICYGLYLIFQLYTHRQVAGGPGPLAPSACVSGHISPKFKIQNIV